MFFKGSDASLDPATSKCFPHVKSILFGLDFKETDLDFLKTMTEVSRNLRFTLTIGHQDSQEGVYNIHMPLDEWVQDPLTVHSSLGKLSFSVPQLLPYQYHIVCHKAMIDNRLNHLESYEDLGNVAEKEAQLDVVEIAYSMKKPIQFSLSYNEGGNSLIGRERDGTPYVIVGKSTLIWTKKMLEDQCELFGLSSSIITDEIVLRCLASDYGVAFDKVYITSQSSFHIDMEMQIIGPKKVILNDSLAAFQLDTQDLPLGTSKEATEYYQQEAQNAKLLEDEAERDLRSMGFEVIRIAGRRYKIASSTPSVVDDSELSDDEDSSDDDDSPKRVPLYSETINMFNIITGINTQKQPFMITLHIPEELRPYFIENVINNVELPEGSIRDSTINLAILDQPNSAYLMDGEGGIQCWTKVLDGKLTED